MDKEDWEQWAADVQSGDTERFVHMVKSLQQPLYRYCFFMLGHAQEAEDAVQDVLVNVYRSMERYRPGTHFRAWVFRIAYNQCISLIRQRRRHAAILALQRLAGLEPETAAPTSPYSAVLDETLHKLSGNDRTLVILKAVEGLDYSEISAILGIKVETLRKRYERSKRKLKGELEGKVHEYGTNG